MNSLEIRYILGEPTVSGSASLIDNYTGCGLGRECYDLCDELSDFPRIPHGWFGNVGTLNDLSRAFWDKRMRFLRVPGAGAEHFAAEERRVKTKRAAAVARNLFSVDLSCLEGREPMQETAPGPAMG